jgi:simple sugar transport system ATP-binding protein
MTTPLLELKGVSKQFGSVVALNDISVKVNAGEVTCILGDNGAGKSTLIKILSGSHIQSSGEYLIEGKSVTLNSPREALDAGIATVFQDLAAIPLLSIWRNFFLGQEPTLGWGPWHRINRSEARKVTKEKLMEMGIDIRDPEQNIGTLSGGERQAVIIARALHFGAKVLILDEPTSALGVKQAGRVLRNIQAASQAGIGVIFITHNPSHAHMVGDRFYLLNRGKLAHYFERDHVTREELIKAMSGGSELDALAHELSQSR